MPLSPDELDQIRDVVRSEIEQQRYGFSLFGFGPRPFTRSWLILLGIFLAVLALHVLVIGGFTVWHLLHAAN